MTSGSEYEDEKEKGYEVRLLRDLRTSVRSIDGKVEEILDEVKEHLEQKSYGNGWNFRDFYDENDDYGLK